MPLRPGREQTPAQKAGLKKAHEARRKNALARRNGEPVPKKELSRNQQLDQGLITVRDLDDEELARQTCRNKDGKFVGGHTFKHRDKTIADMDREFMRRGAQLIRRGFLPAIKSVADLSKYAESEKTRLDASVHLIDRVQGKIVDRVVTVDLTPHSETSEVITDELAKALGMDAAAEILEGEVIADGGEPDDDD